MHALGTGKCLSNVAMYDTLQGMPETETFPTISYGAPYVCDQLSDKGICSAGAFAHPAFLKEHHFENLKSEFFSAIRMKPSVDI